MSDLRNNIVANLVGNVWSTLISIAAVPLYIHFVGIEGYGLVGVCGTIQGITTLLDVGVCATVSREAARLSVRSEGSDELQQTVRSLEILNWSAALAMGILIFAAAPYIAHHWIRSSQLSPASIEASVVLMAILTTVQWPGGFYAGGIMALQNQVELNVVTGISNLVRSFGCILALAFLSPTIEMFFVFNIFTSAAQTIILQRLFRKGVSNPTGKVRFSLQRLRHLWRFGLGMSGITVVTVALGQADKIILSKVLSLEAFGYYSLASAIAGNFPRITSPIYAAVYPGFTRLVALGKTLELAALYHRASQLTAVVSMPIMLVIAWYPYEILHLWTHSPTTAVHTYEILRFLIIAAGLNGLTQIPTGLQLAYGWTSISLILNSCLLFLLVPSLFFASVHYGIIGAGIVLVMVNAVDLIATWYFTHQRLLPQEMRRWFMADTLAPFCAALLLCGFVAALSAPPQSPLFQLAYIASILGLSVVSSAATSGYLRAYALRLSSRVGSIRMRYVDLMRSYLASASDNSDQK